MTHPGARQGIEKVVVVVAENLIRALSRYHFIPLSYRRIVRLEHQVHIPSFDGYPSILIIACYTMLIPKCLFLAKSR